MKTRAQDILPKKLLNALQEYVQGESIYIPKRDGRRKWGVKSGNRAYYDQRNQQIQQLFQEGMTLETLADSFCLSIETIKKIVYRRN
ncbi:CD3324 family protein [Gracilibacillus suaedae]|uniref:CD3324 family protein n=1 Tax=Gracilibacillus suaedae TaxID=2820273 RepID=UPI001ABDA557|nr:CD3324 family protein [Gracilibacillus suaedae]